MVKPTTMQDIAKRAGVSKATVSLALRHHPSISVATRERIQQLQRDMGYRVNRYAQQFIRSTRRPPAHRQLESLVFALVNRRFDDLAYTSFLEGIISESQPRHLAVHTVSLKWEEGNAPDSLEIVADKMADGIIVAGLLTRSFCKAMESFGIPLVVLGTHDLPPGFDQVDCDVGLLAQEACQRLIDGRHRRIAFVAEDSHLAFNRRALNGYEETLRRAGIPLDPRLIITVNRLSSVGTTLVESFFSMREQPTALLCTDSRLTDAFVSTLRARQMRCPPNLELVAFDHHPTSDVSRPYASLLIPSESMGRLAVCRLKEKAENPGTPPAVMLVRNTQWNEAAAPLVSEQEEPTQP
jgi:LacI family transcriptional regulator